MVFFLGGVEDAKVMEANGFSFNSELLRFKLQTILGRKVFANGLFDTMDAFTDDDDNANGGRWMAILPTPTAPLIPLCF